MALSANATVERLLDTSIREYPVGAAVTIYQGAIVGIDPAGYLKPFEPGDEFVGIAYEKFDNSAGAAAAVHPTTGASGCRVFVEGDFKYALTSAALTDKLKPVYATADNAIARTGHPDAYVGRVLHYDSSGYVMIRLREYGEKAPADGTCIDMDIDFAKLLLVDQDESVASLNLVGTGLRTFAVGAGLTASTTGLTVDDATGELEMLIDNDNEAQNLTLQTQQVLNITKGITFEMTGRNKTAGGAATDDWDFGLAGIAATGVTATQHADMNATTATLLAALFHVDTNALSVFASSDDNTTVVAATDTTVDQSLTVNAVFKIIIRVGGSCEFWINGVRMLSTTTFGVGAAGLLSGIINLEKSTGTGVPEVRVRKLRVAGALA